MKRVAWVSPLSPSPALKTAHFSAQLLPLLSREWEIEVFVDDHDTSFEPSHLLRGDALGERETTSATPLNDEFLVFHFHRIHERNNVKPFDLFIHQIEDHKRCNFVRLSAAVWPGICYIHDLNLNDLYYGLYEHTTAPTEINNLTTAQFGEQAPALGDYHIRGWSTEIFDKQYVLGRRDFQKAAVLSVFSHHDGRALTAQCQHENLFVSPVPVVGELRDCTSRVLLRDSLGVSSSDVLVGFCGERYLADRVMPTLQAFSSLRARMKRGRVAVLLWIVWDDVARSEAETALRQFPALADAVRIVVVKDNDTFSRLLGSCTVLSALRFDAARAVPRAVFTAMAEGVPVLVADHAASAELPRDTVLHVPLGEGEELFLTKTLMEVVENSELAQHLATRGRTFVSERCNRSSTAAALRDAVAKYSSTIEQCMAASAAAVAEARKALIEESAARMDAAGFRFANTTASKQLLGSSFEGALWKP